MSRNLDEIDFKILAEIQADGRITNVELAKRVGISPPPCLRRVRALEEEGYIHGYRGLLDARKLGFDTYVIEDAARGIDLNGSLAAAWKQMTAKGVKRIQSSDIALPV